MVLSHLVYSSERMPKCGPEEIDAILEACKRNNSELEITGVLLYTDQYFIQYLEGDSKMILSLYDKIKEDERHHNVRMITLGAIKERVFPSWQMGSKSIHGLDLRLPASAEDKATFQSLLDGEEVPGLRALSLVKRFFES